MTLTENEFPLGPDRAPLELIRAPAAGAYQHWGDTLYFSSSDGSDPRINGRSYTYRVDATLRPKIRNLGILAGFIGLLCFFISHGAAPRLQAPAHTANARRPRVSRLLGLTTAASGLVLAALLVAAPSMQSPQRIPLKPEAISHAGGFAYYAFLTDDQRWPWRRARALTTTFARDMPQLIENGIPVGTPTLGFLGVRKGEGRFAYFGNAVAFSASDATDPRSSGRRYEFEVGVEPAPSSYYLVLGLFAVGVFIALWGRGRALVNAFSLFGPSGSERDKAYRENLRPAVIDYSLLILAVVTAIAALLLNWWTGSTSSLGVASFFPVSDAFGYFQCALSVGISDTLNAPHFGVEWCSRRALYPATLGSLLALSGWRPSLVLLVQAGMIGLAGGVLLLTLQRTFGWITALLSAVGVLLFAHTFALGNFMTESLGVVAGLCGLSLLLLSVQRNAPIPMLLVGGLGIFSIGMAMRAGALFAIPSVAVWTLYATHRMAWASRWRLLLAAGAALSLGLGLHFLVVYSEGSNARNMGGNSAVVLYGLSTGSRDWSQAHRDFAGDFATAPETVVYEKIRDVALTNLRDKPKVFVHSLLLAGASFVTHLFFLDPIKQYNNLTTAAFLLGLLVCLAYWRHPGCALLLAFALGELASAPFIFDSGGHRLFAVTVAARLIIAAVGIAWILAVAVRLKKPALDNASGSDPNPRICGSALGLSATLLFLAIFALTPLVTPLRLAPVTRSKLCGEEEMEVVTRLGRESSQMTLGESRLPFDGETLGVRYGRLELDPLSRREWWLGELKPQAYGTTLIYAVQRTGQHVGMIVPAFAPNPISASGQLVSLCLSKEAPGTLKLGDFNFLRVIRSHAH